jgi:hypothetical protein
MALADNIGGCRLVWRYDRLWASHGVAPNVMVLDTLNPRHWLIPMTYFFAQFKYAARQAFPDRWEAIIS